MIRIGIGYDIHRLVEGRKLFLGGVEIPHSKGLLGHSDADVVLHSLCDAMLGALALKDIGTHFSNKDERWKNIDSKVLLKKTYELIKEQGYTLINCDIMLIAEEPKISPYIDKMTVTIAEILETSGRNISIKATTNEGVGDIGKGEAMACYSVVLLQKSSSHK